MSNPAESICAAAITNRVFARPGRAKARNTGSATMAPPSATAAQTCGCVRLSAPAQVSGDTHTASTTIAAHWNTRSPANIRSVRRWIAPR